MIIKKQRKIKFVNQCTALVSQKELEKAILWYSDKPVSRVKTIYIYGKYPAISIYEKKIHIHRLLMMYWVKRDLDTQEYVHHIDGDRFNSLRENLEILLASNHQSLANKGRKQSRQHILRRTNSTTLTRYGHSIYENPELLKGA